MKTAIISAAMIWFAWPWIEAFLWATFFFWIAAGAVGG